MNLPSAEYCRYDRKVMQKVTPVAALIGVTSACEESILWEECVWRELKWSLNKAQHVQRIFLSYAELPKESFSSDKCSSVVGVREFLGISFPGEWFSCFRTHNPAVNRPQRPYGNSNTHHTNAVEGCRKAKLCCGTLNSEVVELLSIDYAVHMENETHDKKSLLCKETTSSIATGRCSYSKAFVNADVLTCCEVRIITVMSVSTISLFPVFSSF